MSPECFHSLMDFTVLQKARFNSFDLMFYLILWNNSG